MKTTTAILLTILATNTQAFSLNNKPSCSTNNITTEIKSIVLEDDTTKLDMIEFESIEEIERNNNSVICAATIIPTKTLTDQYVQIGNKLQQNPPDHYPPPNIRLGISYLADHDDNVKVKYKVYLNEVTNEYDIKFNIDNMNAAAEYFNTIFAIISHYSQ
jgi:hypothetical protein